MLGYDYLSVAKIQELEEKGNDIIKRRPGDIHMVNSAVCQFTRRESVLDA